MVDDSSEKYANLAALEEEIVSDDAIFLVVDSCVVVNNDTFVIVSDGITAATAVSDGITTTVLVDV